LSQENVEVVLDAYARYNAGEPRQDLSFWHTGGELHAVREGPDTAVHRGVEAIGRQFQRWEEAYPDLKVEPLEAKGNGDKVFLWVRFIGHGAASALPMVMELAHVFTLRDGQAASLTEYFDRAEALEAAGLEE
jgi:ketosteroid isomerase-like protein